MASGRNSAPSVLNGTEDSKSTEQFSDLAIMKMDYMKFDKDFVAWSDAFPDGLSAKNSAEAQLPNSSAMAASLELNQVDGSSGSYRLPVDYGNGDYEIKQEKQYDICSAQRGTQNHKLDFAFRLITAGHKSVNNNLIQAENRTVHVKSFVPHSTESYSASSDEACNSHSNIIYENKSMAMAFMRIMIKNRSFRQQLDTGKKTLLQVVNEEEIDNKLTKITADHTPDTCIGADYNLNYKSSGKHFQQNLDPEKEIRCQALNKGRNSYKVIRAAADHTVATRLFADIISKSKGPFALTNMGRSYASGSNANNREAGHITTYMNPDNDIEIDTAEGNVSTSYDGIYNSDNCKTNETGTNIYNGSTGLVQRENINVVAKSDLQYGVLDENVSTVNGKAHTMNNDLDPLPSASMTPSSMVEGLIGRNSFKVNFDKKCFRITPS